jgi:hypothetical protein
VVVRMLTELCTLQYNLSLSVCNITLNRKCFKMGLQLTLPHCCSTATTVAEKVGSDSVGNL